jgi:hypothetical protein
MKWIKISGIIFCEIHCTIKAIHSYIYITFHTHASMFCGRFTFVNNKLNSASYYSLMKYVLPWCPLSFTGIFYLANDTTYWELNFQLVRFDCFDTEQMKMICMWHLWQRYKLSEIQGSQCLKLKNAEVVCIRWNLVDMFCRIITVDSCFQKQI